jgi:hypothetical protein
MDFRQAISDFDTEVHLAGQSDDALVRRIRKQKGFRPPAKALSPAAGLGTGIRLRPIEALHQLSFVTRPRYQDELLDAYLYWGLLRYLGFFALDHSVPHLPRLGVSDAGRRITGNLRRVASEEMGIAFGVALARRWFEQTGAGAPPVAVDVDVALDDGRIFGAGAPVRHVARRRPDYILVAPGSPGEYRFRVLECKGTKTLGYAEPQLASAVEQLDGVAVGTWVPHGLATSVITSGAETCYRAVDTIDGPEPSFRLTSETIEGNRDFRFEAERPEELAEEVAAASVRASWAMLADFGSNFVALRKWAPQAMLGRTNRRERPRTTFDTPLGTATGTSTTFDFDRERLIVRYGIDDLVDEQLAGDSAEAVMGAQQAFARRLAEARYRFAESGTIFSLTADGSIFSLTLTKIADTFGAAG